MPRHLDDHQNLNSSRIYSSGSNPSLPLNSSTSSNTTTRTDAVDSRVGTSSSIPVTTGSAGSTLSTVNVLSHHTPNRTASSVPLSQGHAGDGTKPVGQRQPLALIQETVRSVGSVSGTEMQTGIQYSQPSGYPSRVAAAATTLSQASHIHNQNPSQHHHPHPSQVQAHSAQVLHPNQANSQSSATQVSGHQFQRLKVEDALSYLDQVKYKFGNQPQVYNDFLDIMKEFKSQSIDTPGVIQRVSTLFKGHPELIVGFNTFLPPGYRIEVQSNEQVQVSIPGTNLGTGSATGPTSLTINPGGSITQPLHTTHGSHLNHLSHSTSPHHSTGSVGNKSLNHQPPITNSQVLKETSQNQLAYNQSSPAHTHSSGASPSVHSPNSAPQANQPVEFNHAINYVNKIKNRFQGQPDIYKQFLEILHTYQKEQRNLKDGINTTTKPLTEAEVYSQVANLFQNQDDLLQEFGQFLPDANGAANALVSLTLNNDHPLPVNKKPAIPNKPAAPPVSTPAKPAPVVKRPSSSAPSPPIKKPKMTSLKDVSLSEAGKHGSLNEYAFFDKVRKALKSQEVYDNVLRLIILYNQEIISRADLVQLIAPFLSRFPDLFKWFRDFLGYKDIGNTVESLPNKVTSNTQERERVVGDFATEIDYSSCKKYGASYRAVPRNYVQPKCSGRAELDEKERQVLNDTWVSFPSWSEDSTFVSSRKTQYEEYIYRCEDERFELDVVLDSNLSTIHALEAVQSKMDRMSTEEKAKFRLDDTLGGNSTVIHQRAVKRLYGDKAPDVIEGLKKNPVTAVPLVLKRLKAKEEEWRRAQKSFNKIWRDQNEKYYLKSLDHQGISFKQNDVKYLRSKSLLNEIENMYEERHEQAEDGDVPVGPHILVVYKNKDIIKDAANLIIHHVKRQTGMHKDDKQKIKQLMRQFIPDLYGVPRVEMSDDEGDNDDMEIDDDNENSKSGYQNLLHLKYGSSNHDSFNCTADAFSSQDVSNSQDKNCCEKVTSTISQSLSLENSLPGDSYSLFFVNNNWYIFFRLHYILCERLCKIYDRSQAMLVEELKDRKERKKSTAIALRLKPKTNIAVEAYYATFLDMIKSLLDQNIDANQYEDTLREMFGIEAYWAFTMEKVVQNVVRQLQHIVGDDSCTQCTSLFLEEQKSRSTGGLCATAAQRSANEAAYQRKAEQILSDENCYKAIIYKNEGKLTIELLDSESDQLEEPGVPDKWTNYVGKFVGEESLPSEVKERITKWPVFLPRNVRTRRQREKISESKNNDSVAQDVGQSPSYMTDGDLDSKIDLSCLEDSTAGDAVKGLVGLNSKSRLIDKARSKAHEDPNNRAECKFNMRSYKIVFVVHSDSVLYNQYSLRRARQFHKKVSCKLNKHFHAWHKKWLKDNVSEEDAKKCLNWLIGNTEDNKPTVCVKVDNPTKPPYYCYNRYHVQEKT